MKRIIIFFCFILAVCVSSARSGILTTADDPSVVGGGARALGMGRAFCAIADDSDGMLINPAGIAGMKCPQVMTMFTNIMGEVYYGEVTGAIPSKIGTLGMAYISTGVNQVLTPVGGQYVYSDYNDSLFLLTYSTPLSRFFDVGQNVFVGLNGKIFSRSWSGGLNQSALGYSADFGVKFIANPYLSFGLNRQNFLPVSMGGVIHWGTGTDEAFATLTKVGVAFRPVPLHDKMVLALDFDLPASSSRPMTSHLGLEYKVNPYFTARGGFDQSVDAASASRTSWSPCGGASFEYKGFRLDYAYHPFYDEAALSNSYVSFSYKWDASSVLKGETI